MLGVPLGGAAAVELARAVVQERRPAPELPRALSEDVKAVAADFRSIAQGASPMLRSYLKKAHLSAGEGDRLLLVLDDEVSAAFVGRQEHREEIEQLIAQKTGKKMEVDVRRVEAGRRFEDSFVDIEKLIHMDITIED